MVERETQREVDKKVFHIGVDLDQVVTNAFENVVKHFNYRFGTQFTLDDIKAYYFLEEVDIGAREDRVALLRRWYSDERIVFDDAIPIKDSKEIIHKLLLERHDIQFVTSREPHLRTRTIEWLRQFNFPASDSNVHFREKDDLDGVRFKVSKASELRLNLFIEDDSRVAEQLGIPVILLDYPWNREVKTTNVHRVANWQEVYQLIQRLRTQ